MKCVTHLVVEPHHRHALARIVPVELAQALANRSGIALSLTIEEVRRLAPLQESTYLRLDELPVNDPDWGVGVQDVLAFPYYGEPYSARGHGWATADPEPGWRGRRPGGRRFPARSASVTSRAETIPATCPPSSTRALSRPALTRASIASGAGSSSSSTVT